MVTRHFAWRHSLRRRGSMSFHSAALTTAVTSGSAASGLGSSGTIKLWSTGALRS